MINFFNHLLEGSGGMKRLRRKAKAQSKAADKAEHNSPEQEEAHQKSLVTHYRIGRKMANRGGDETKNYRKWKKGVLKK